MPELPDGLGMGAIFLALATAWAKFRPAMKKLETEEDSSLRGDLLKRISSLEEAERLDRQRHVEEIKAIREECNVTIQKMTDRHDAIVQDYEAKLTAFQLKADLLMDALLESKRIEGIK